LHNVICDAWVGCDGAAARLYGESAREARRSVAGGCKRRRPGRRSRVHNSSEKFTAAAAAIDGGTADGRPALDG